MLGRWNRHDNIDIKTTLANIDSCGDRLCGDVRETRAVIRKFQLPTPTYAATPPPMSVRGVSDW